MYISSISLLVFVIVLIVLELVAKDTNVLVVSWVLIWSLAVYLLNQSEVLGLLSSCSCQRPSGQSGGGARPATTSTASTPRQSTAATAATTQQQPPESGIRPTAPPPPTFDYPLVDYPQTQPLL